MKKGFFLVEILVSLSIFTLIAVSTAGALLVLLDANAKAQSLKSVIDNMNVAVENMSRAIRFGSSYTCNGASSSGLCAGADGISFTAQDGSSVRYYLKDNSIYRLMTTLSAVQTDIVMTAPEVTITGLQFYIYGAGIGDGQPRVLIAINGKAGIVTSIESSFALQTTVSQRQPDANL